MSRPFADWSAPLLTPEEALENHRQALMQANRRTRELVAEADQWQTNAVRLWRLANALEAEVATLRAERTEWQRRYHRLRVLVGYRAWSKAL